CRVDDRYNGLVLRPVVALCLILPAACSRFRSTPELSKPPLEKLHPVVREEIDKAYQAALAAPKDADLSGELGMLLHAHEQRAAAETYYRRAQSLDSKSFVWPYLLGVARLDQSRFAEAETALRDALRVDPKDTNARLGLADALFSLKRIDESERHYTELAKSDPARAAVHYGLGRIAAARSNFPAAIEHLRKACRLFPAYGAAQQALGDALIKSGSAADAAPHMEMALRFKLVRPPPHDLYLDNVVRRITGPARALRWASELAARGKLPEAAARYETYLKMEEASDATYVSILGLYDRLRKDDVFLAHFKRAVELHPKSPELYRALGNFHVRRKDYGEAEAALRKAVAVNPNHAEAHATLGEVLEVRGRTEEAREHFETALKNRPSYRTVHYVFGRSLVKQGKHKEAIPHLEQALKPEDANTSVVYYELANAWRKLGDRVKADQLLREARGRVPGGQAELRERIESELSSLSR
ncbi:MAG: tetratricopeptide repeat protein, partial [Bryobacteraceae bacterium]